jgi:glycosyltransferase involved in cell wall biosynthesis
MRDNPEVSMIIPAYNEEKNLEEAVYGAAEQFREVLDVSFEIIIVEDGSIDKTKDIAELIDNEINEAKHLHLDKRRGKGRALEEGFKTAEGNILAYMDADYSTDLNHIPDLIRPVGKEAEVIVGSRRLPESQVKRSKLRKLASWGYNNFLSLLFDSKVSDHQCGFKAAEADKLLGLMEEFERSHWVWDAEFLIRAQRQGMIVEEIPVKWEENGESSLNLIWDTLDIGSKTVEMFLEIRKEKLEENIQ